jgi:hypothetical protein
LRGQLDEIRRLKKNGFQVAAVNTAHDWLWDNGVEVDIAAALDPRPWVKGYFRPRKGTTYLIASQVHPDVWPVFEGHDVYCWHNLSSEDDRHGFKKLKSWTGVAEKDWVFGGNTVGLRLFTLFMPLWIGFGSIAIFGFDSSFDGSSLHVTPKHTEVQVDKKANFVRLLDPKTRQPLDKQYMVNGSMLEQAGLAEKHMIHQIAREQLAGRFPRWFKFWFNGRGYLPDLMALYGFHKDADAIAAELRRGVPKIVFNEFEKTLQREFAPVPPNALTVDADFFADFDKRAA